MHEEKLQDVCALLFAEVQRAEESPAQSRLDRGYTRRLPQAAVAVVTADWVISQDHHHDKGRRVAVCPVKLHYPNLFLGSRGIYFLSCMSATGTLNASVIA